MTVLLRRKNDSSCRRRQSAPVERRGTVLRETVPQAPREAGGLNDCADGDFAAAVALPTPPAGSPHTARCLVNVVVATLRTVGPPCSDPACSPLSPRLMTYNRRSSKGLSSQRTV